MLTLQSEVRIGVPQGAHFWGLWDKISCKISIKNEYWRDNLEYSGFTRNSFSRDAKKSNLATVQYFSIATPNS